MVFWEFELHGMTFMRLHGALEMDSNNAYYSYFFYDRSAHVTDLRVVSLPKPLGSRLYLRQKGLLGSFTFEEGLCPLKTKGPGGNLQTLMAVFCFSYSFFSP